MNPISSVRTVFEMLAAGGSQAYFGEPVSVLEHSLQAAWFVQRQGGGYSMIAAALLHDLGHLMHTEGEDAAERGLDTRHEELAVAVLQAHFSSAVLDPVRLHVAAKRYLCFADANYLAALSEASIASLGLQGGPMTTIEAEAFLHLPYAREAIRLRHADDRAKVRGLAVPDLNTYRPLVISLWR
jgi:[1-hydroxy-2-(trimethylamino)ethyl]phosphonate dioxygenase